MINDSTIKTISTLPDAKSVNVRKEARPRRSAKRSKASHWLHTNVHRRLLQLCIDMNTSQQKIFDEALDLWLRKHGEPSISELEGEGERK